MEKIIIIPAYNEELNIKSVIEEINRNLSDFDIVVIDDGSTDATAEIAMGCGATVIGLPYNLGIGAAMQTGYKYAHRNGYEIAIQFDGDGQHRADQIETLLKPLLEGKADLVVGSRFLSPGKYPAPWTRLAGIKVLSVVVSLISGNRITDPTSGFRAANRRTIDFFSKYYPDDYPEPETLVLLKKAGFRIAEVSVLMRERQRGSSSITPLRALYYMVKVLLAVMIDTLKKAPGKGY